LLLIFLYLIYSQKQNNDVQPIWNYEEIIDY
jgi:hypothetical protein